MIIRAPRPNINEPRTYLTASVAAAATAITVANTAGFVANDYVVIGKPGQEGAELHKISTVVANTTINLVDDAIDFAISVNTPVTYIKYNQVRFYMGDWSARCHTGTVAIDKNSKTLTGTGTTWAALTTASALLLNGKWHDIASVDSATQITLTDYYTDENVSGISYALVLFAVQTGSTVAIAVDQEETLWDDTDALLEDYYRTDYYNSTSVAASTKSSIIAAAEDTGFSEYTLQSLEDEVLSELRDPEAKRRTRAEIDVDINNGLKELINAIVSDVQEDYLNTYDTVDFLANVGEYKLFDDFRKLTSVWISYNGSDYKKAIPMRIGDDVPDAEYNAADPRYYLRDNIIGVKPTPTSAVTTGAKVWYERRIPSLRYEGDEIPYILRDYKRSLVAYALDKACMADDKEQKALSYRAEFMQAKQDMAEGLKDRDLDAVRTVEIVNDWDLYI